MDGEAQCLKYPLLTQTLSNVGLIIFNMTKSILGIIASLHVKKPLLAHIKITHFGIKYIYLKVVHLVQFFYLIFIQHLKVNDI